MANASHPTQKTAKSKSGVVGDNRKPRKPYPDFPLTPRSDGRFCKKIRGTVYIFGRVGGTWQDALEQYQRERDDLFAGRLPAARKKDDGGLRLVDLCNRFIHFKSSLIKTGELSPLSWRDYHATCERLMKVLGKDRLVEDIKQDDFAQLRQSYGETWGVVRIKGEINRVRILFRFAQESGLIEKVIRFGPAFDPPKKSVLRRNRKKAGRKMFEPDELRRILAAASVPLRAMILLALNGGLGNCDVASLPMKAIDLEKRWISFPRPKTAIDREIPLWVETIDAIQEYLAIRKEPARPEDADLLFVTKYRRAWITQGRLVEVDGRQKIRGVDDAVSKAFRKLLDSLSINGSRGFYTLRHVFETVAGDTGDQVAVNAVMGHADQSMSSHYRERIDSERLRRVVEHVRQWLFAASENNTVPPASDIA